MSGNNVVLARNTENAPKSTLSSQSVAFSHYTNLSGQLPIDPKTGQLVSGGVTEQAVQCLNNIKEIVSSIGHVMSDIVRLTIFVQNIKDMDAVDQVYQTYFSGYLPARTVAAVAALPMGALVQMDALVSNGEGTIPNAPQAGDLIKLTNHTQNAPSCALSAQTVAFSHYNNLSAQLPIDPKSGRLVEGGIKEQTSQCLKNIKAILASLDVPFDDIVKITVFLTQLEDEAAVDQVYRTFFPDSAIARTVSYVPARTTIAVSALPMNALVQIEAVVSHGDGTPPQAVEDRHGLIIEANNTALAPVCPLSTQTVAFSHYNNVAAQLPVSAKTGRVVSGGVAAQAEQCLANIKAIVESIDHVMDDVVKVSICLTSLADMEAVDQVYASYFPGGIPARSVVGVSALPMGALVQMDAIVGNAEGTPPSV